MRMMQRLCLSLLCLLLAVPSFAQRSTATIRGTITDSTGAVIDGAQVTAKNEETGFTRTTKTNPSGIYTFSDLPIGSYQVSVEHTGFKGSVHKGVVLNVADNRVVDAQLETGAIQETITIEAAPVQVQTAGGDMSGLITGEQVRELPLNGRNFLQLALLMPGVSAPDFLNVKDKGLLGGSDLSVSGSSTTSNVWTVDGANNNDVGSNRTILVYPSIDAIEEFKIHRNSYGPEFGGAGGAQVNVVTRGGTNEFHGSVFYFARNDKLNSTNYFLKKAGKEKEQLKRHDFGYTFGGPLIKDKLHFFLSQEWNRETRGSVRTASVPTMAERAGDFSGSGCSGSGALTDPLTGAPFPGNVIPSNRQSPAALAMLKIFPAPNTSGCPNWIDSVDTKINWRQENARVDWTLSNSTRLMVRYTQDSWINDAPSLQGNLWGDDPFPSVDSKWNQPSRSLIVQLNNNIGATGVNTLTFSYSANKIDITRPEHGGSSLNGQINAAFPSTFPRSGKHYGNEDSHPVFWGGVGVGPDLWSEAPFLNNQDLVVLKDDYSKVFGNHLVKIGLLGSMNAKNEDNGGASAAEAPQFWGPTGLNGWGGTTGRKLGDFLLQDMSWGFSENNKQVRALVRWRDIEAYAADSWKAHPRLTVDLGARISLFRNPYLDDNQATSFSPTAYDAALGGDPCNGLLYAGDTNPCAALGFRGGQAAPARTLGENPGPLVAPRLGVAWDVSGNGKTALRAGFGTFYLRERVNSYLNLVSNPPFVANISGTRTFDNAQTPEAFGASFGSPQSGRKLETLLPHNYQWNVALEREIFKNSTIEVAYVGNKGSDLLLSRDINQVPLQNRLAFVQASGNGGAQAALRPYPNWGGDKRITFWDHEGSSIYHSLQTQFVTRFGQGSQFQASYTWSRFIADQGLDNADGGLTRDTSVTSSEAPELDRGLTKTHRTHIFNASLVLALPKLEEKSSFVKNVFGDWQLGTIVVAESGTALTVYTPSTGGAIGVSGPSGTGYPDNNRPLRTGEPCSVSGGDKEQILNPAAWTMTGFRLGTVGTSGRGVCYGPDFFQTDVSLYKNLKLSQRLTAQLRFDVFNVFNRANFHSASVNNTFVPDATLDSASLATATTITSSALPAGNTFGKASSAKDPRQAQVAIKLLF
jgi:hypothetical protein